MKNKNKIIIFVVTIICLCCTSFGYAATYYVREDGGSTSQCTGLVDAPYSGSGSNQPCALSHPFYAIAPIGNNPTKLQGGDTLIIDGSNNADYQMGYGAPNANDTSICYSAWPWDCYMRSVPSGSSPTNPTRILGKGWDSGCQSPPELWGTERANRVLNLAGSSNVEVQCLEVTDRSSCQEHGPSPCNRDTPPFGNWAQSGIVATDSENVLIKNVNIHGMAYRGIYAGRLKDWTIEDTKIVANSFVGWDGDVGAFNSSNSGTMTFNNTDILYSGCGETYPDEKPYNCYSQDQGGYGDGLGTHQTGAHWVFNNCDISHNVSDGLDLLYHNGDGSITIKRSRFEGNAGNQVKTGADTKIENSVIIGNCAYFDNNDITWNSATFNNCRAGGNAIAIAYHTGMTAEIKNSTITSNGDTITQSAGSDCLGTEKIVSRNNIYLGGTEFNDGSDLSAFYWAAGATGNGDGSCGSVNVDDDYSVIWNTKHIATDCDGRPNSICQDPQFEEPFVRYYSGDAFRASLKLTSPAREKANVLTGMSSLDYNSFDRGSGWDIGALEYGSYPTDAPVSPATCADGIQYCSNQQECVNESYYWYLDSCHSSPEAQPECADWYNLCLTQSDCQGAGYYWYNNVCNAQPDAQLTCADAIDYCTTQNDCVAQNYYWYNDVCNAQPDVQLTCADSIDYCSTQQDCVNQSYYWYDNSCHAGAQPSLSCADSIDYCSTQQDCIDQSYYWYNDACYVEAQGTLTCVDDRTYCTSALECNNTGNYWHWHNDTCNVEPPSCEISPIYCYSSDVCLANGYSWDDNRCNAELATPQLTCADGIEYCTDAQSCESENYYWYNNGCNTAPESLPTCADSIDYCVVSSDCDAQGYYWYDGSCNVDPEPIPTCADSIEYCTDRLSCLGMGHYWYDDACQATPTPTCADDIQYCTDKVSCISVGHHWYDNVCNVEPEPVPTCVDGIEYCTDQGGCELQGYSWYNNACHVEPESLPTCVDGIEYCAVQSDCELQGYNWYNDACHIAPEVEMTCADDRAYCTSALECNNTGNYWHWHNDTCNVEPPSCEISSVYCYSADVCSSNGYYWYNNFCNAVPEGVSEPTCADGIEYCADQSDCELEGYSWYNNVCNVEPEPEPTCADGIEYCTGPVDCELQGYNWYNNVCNVEPEPEPTCVDGIEYCTVQANCELEGYSWYNNECNIEPESELTCADGIEYCTGPVDCELQGYNWYNNVCNVEPEPEPTCADGIEYCTVQADCELEGYSWYANACHVEPEPQLTCEEDGQYCTNAVDCNSTGNYWYWHNDTCNVEPPSCEISSVYCYSADVCSENGYYWYNDFCNAGPEVLASEPTCADGVEYCTDSLSCSSEGNYWYNETCHVAPEPQLTCADGAAYCTTDSSCSNMGNYWYDGACHEQQKVATTTEVTVFEDIITGGDVQPSSSGQVEEPTCADGSEYCKTRSTCSDLGYYWHGGKCNATADPKKTDAWSEWKKLIQERWRHLFK
ncbi:hypothetical protein ACFL49_03100 [Candidatus Omnitrophota bacterium]